MTHLKRKLMMTLVALLALTTHAWAQDAFQVKEFVPPVEWENVNTNVTEGDFPGFDGITEEQAKAWTGAPSSGFAYLIYDFDGVIVSLILFENGHYLDKVSSNQLRSDLYTNSKGGTKFYYPFATPVPLTQGTGDKINEWTLTNKMPAGNVTVNVKYFPKAEFAMSTGTTPVPLAPTAIDNVAATTDNPIVKAGTVANITGSQTPQGTLMYYASQTAMTDAQLQALTSSDWKNTVPTASDLAKGNAYVYYYIQGAEPAQGTDRTDANTCSDGDILATNVVNVTLGDAPLWNAEFDLTNAPEEDKTGKWSTSITGEGVVKGTNVTVTYTGTKKILGVKAEKKSASTPLDDATTAWTAGTYAVPAGGLTYSDAITVSGDVTLVLTDGETLTLNKGISIADGATLTIQGNGTMNVNGTKNSTASTVAGTGTLVLTSGTLNAKGGNGAGLGNSTSGADMRAYAGGNAINGNVTVSGGTLTATGGNGGVVGEISSYSYGAAGGTAISGSVTVTGGAVTATGGNGGSIGSSTHDAYGGNGGAAIGGDATLTGGTWTATDGTHGANNGGQGGAGGKAVAGTVTDNR